MLRRLLLAVALSGIWVIALRLVVLVATVGIVGSRHCDDDEWRLVLRGQELMNNLDVWNVKLRNGARVFESLRGHQQLIPRQAQPQPNRFPHLGPWRARRSEDTPSQPLSVKRVAQQSFAISHMRISKARRDGLQGTPCFRMRFNLVYSSRHVWTLTVHSHFYHLELSTSTPSLPYHAIFAMRPLGHVLTANFRASSKSNRPIPNAMGRK